ncbi:MAG: hypothetical protein ABUL62_26305 [Myxococcales bacterium]
MSDALDNAEVVRALRDLALRLAEQRDTFHAQGLLRAVHSIEGLERPILELWLAGGFPALTALPWVGRAVAHWLIELLSLGRIAELERARRAYPKSTSS